MTRYVLHGGARRKSAPEADKAFMDALIGGLHGPIKALICPFARPENEWQMHFEEEKALYLSSFPERSFDFQLAEPARFAEQTAWADLIYFHGGDAERELIEIVGGSGWEKHIDRKTIGGSSAGADLMSTYYYDLVRLNVQKGLSLLPIKVIVHWKSDYNAPNIDWDKAYEDLKNRGEDLPILTLAEGEFKILTP